MKRLIAFDLDGTLAASKQPIDDEMSRLLARSLAVRLVAVISGGDWPQFELQLVSRLSSDANLGGLFLLPTSGTKLYRFAGSWRQIYAENFTPAESRRIVIALRNAIATAGLAGEASWGKKIEDRGSQVTFSGLGQMAPLDAKSKWDPDREKRNRMKALLEDRLPDFAVHIGGSTSIDITSLGVDKAYAMNRLAAASGLDPDEMLFIGDALYPGGNDAPVRAAGIETVAVANIDETRRVIAGIVRS